MKVQNIKECVRCGEDHLELEMKEFTFKGKYSHYAVCPNNTEPILINIKEEDEEIKLDRFHYHEFMDRSYYILEIIEAVYNHPVRSQHKEIDKQVEKIMMECAELYQMTGNLEDNYFDEKFMPDIRNKLTPMLTLTTLVKEGHINDPKFSDIVKDTVERVEFNVNYISNLKE